MRRFLIPLAVAFGFGCVHPAATSAPAASTRPRAYLPAAPASRELSPDQQVQQVLNRLSFGPRPGDAEKVKAMGVDRWIDQQLHPETISDRAADLVLARYTALETPTSDIVEAYQAQQAAQRQVKQAAGAAGDTVNKPQIRQLAVQQVGANAMLAAVPLPQKVNGDLNSSLITRAVLSDRQLDEVMVEFWENHFSVFQGKGQTRLFLSEYDRDVIRPNAMGNFRQLLGAVAHSSAMLFYLDNWQSQADSVHPTLAQVQRGGRGGRGAVPPAAAGRGRGAAAPLPPAIAGALTPAQRQALAAATPEERQRMLQRIMAAAPQAVNAARQKKGLNENYARELMELHTLGVDGGYTQHDVIEVARALSGWSIAMQQGGGFIFRPEMHDAGEKVVLGHTLAAGRGLEDGEQVLDIVAAAPATAHFITTKLARHFISDDPPASVVDRCAQVFTATSGDIRQTVGCVVTSPEFFSKAAYRSKVKTPFEVVVSAFRAVDAVPDGTPRSAQPVTQLGQPLFGRQTPDGWPDRGDAWMNTGSILNRINFGVTLATGGVPGVTLSSVPQIEALRNAPRQQQVDGVVNLLFGGDASPETRDILLTGENPFLAKAAGDSAMTTANVDPMAGVAGRGGRGARPGAAAPVRPNAAGAGRGGRGAAPVTRPVDLQGLAQVIGLALGAPEFQRR
jgi:uncharacterized protein (DUF1800 family)